MAGKVRLGRRDQWTWRGRPCTSEGPVRCQCRGSEGRIGLGCRSSSRPHPSRQGSSHRSSSDRSRNLQGSRTVGSRRRIPGAASGRCTGMWRSHRAAGRAWSGRRPGIGPRPRAGWCPGQRPRRCRSFGGCRTLGAAPAHWCHRRCRRRREFDTAGRQCAKQLTAGLWRGEAAPGEGSVGRHGQRRRRSGGRGEEVGIDDGAGVALNPGNQTGASRIERHKHQGATDGADGGDADGAILVAAAR